MTAKTPDLAPESLSDPQPGTSGPLLSELLASVERDLAHAQSAVSAGCIIDLTPLLGPIGDLCSRIGTLDRDAGRTWLSTAESLLASINQLEAAMTSYASALPDSPNHADAETQPPETRSRSHRAYASAAMVQTGKQGR